MIAKTRIIEANGKPEYAVIPYRDYLRLVEAEEDAEDVRAIEEFERKLAAGEEELLPAEMVHRLVQGENPILVWREYRGLTQEQLAKAAGVGQAYISTIELGQRQGTVEKLHAISLALKVQVDDLLAWDEHNESPEQQAGAIEAQVTTKKMMVQAIPKWVSASISLMAGDLMVKNTSEQPGA